MCPSIARRGLTIERQCWFSQYLAHAKHRLAIWLQVVLSTGFRAEAAIRWHSWACRRNVSERFIFIAAVALQKKIKPAPNPNRVTRTGFRRAPKTLGGWRPREDAYAVEQLKYGLKVKGSRATVVVIGFRARRALPGQPLTGYETHQRRWLSQRGVVLPAGAWPRVGLGSPRLPFAANVVPAQ